MENKKSADFNLLPNEIKQHITKYLNTTTLGFFAMTSKQSLKVAERTLAKYQANILRYPNLTIAEFNMYFSYQSMIYKNAGLLRIGHDSHCLLSSSFSELVGNIQQIIRGGTHTFILTDEMLYACGNNDEGQLGLELRYQHNTWTPVKNVPGEILQIMAGERHTLMLTDQGLFACGDNSHGQLGLGHNNNCLGFTLVKNIVGKIKQIFAGHNHTLVLTDQGLFTCGNNNHGQLGLGHNNNCNILTSVENVNGKIKQVIAGKSHTCVITGQGLCTWGRNNYGQLGLSHKQDCNIPAKVESLTDSILQIATSDCFTVALTELGLYVCGFDILNWVQIKNPPGVVQQIVLGDFSLLVLTSTGLYALNLRNANQDNYIMTPLKNLPPVINQHLALYRQIDWINILNKNESNKNYDKKYCLIL